MAESFGDSLTYYIWSEEAKQVIVRSVVRPYDNSEDASAPNFHAEREFEIHDSPTDTDMSEPDNIDTTDFDADYGIMDDDDSPDPPDTQPPSDDTFLFSFAEHLHKPPTIIDPAELVGYKFVEPHEGLSQ